MSPQSFSNMVALFVALLVLLLAAWIYVIWGGK